VSTEPGRYLEGMRARLRLESASKREVLCELRAHFEDRADELEEAGLPREEAVRVAAESFGSLGTVVDELNQVHNSSNWPQTVVAALPHLLFCLLFALHQWSNGVWLAAIVVSTVGVAIYGWQHNKPTWFFTWLGYALMPLLVVGFFLMEEAFGSGNFLSKWWVWPLMVVYFPVILWLFVHILLQVLKRDWLLGSLMALPVPAMVGWFMTADWREALLGSDKQSVHSLEPWIALSFLTLAGIVVLFTRLRQRSLRAGVLLISGLAILVFMTCSNGGNIDLLHLVVLGSVMLFILLGPALLEHRVLEQEAKYSDILLGRNLRT
jgi:hypothetical protein